jgi:uncharacterized radical SAM protein YgiQ
MQTEKITPLFSYRKFWAARFGIAPFLPMSRAEMDDLGWDSCDIIIVTGDAYVDHPSFGMALLGRLLEAQGFRVGIISQPDWRSAEAFKILGKPNLFFGVTAGNMDSMVNHYTADRKIRTDDAYTPGNVAGKRPDRATLVYAQRCREAFSGVPIVIGGVEASLRRTAHYDYWSDKVKHSVLLDSKADMLIYGNAERAIIELAHRLARREKIGDITDLRGTTFMRKEIPLEFMENKECHPNENGDLDTLDSRIRENDTECSRENYTAQKIICLPSYEDVANDPVLYAHATRLIHLEVNPHNARPLMQTHGNRLVWLNPPPIPLTTAELDYVYDLPFARKPHPSYGDAVIPAYDMIKFSVNILRGCFGGCSFCSIALHEGHIIQNRSEESILREIEAVRDKTPGFTGIVSDLGGPTANMYNLKCTKPEAENKCRRFSCIYPKICPNMNTNHHSLIQLYRKARALPGIKKILIGSGVRYDLAVKSTEYISELAQHHVGGYLKIAPEHVSQGPLSKMMKPGIDTYQHFKELFDKASQKAGKEQYLIPYFIAAHPGTTDEDMLELALWLKANKFRLDKVQNFFPTPMTLATAMYHSEKNPLQPVTATSEKVFIPKKGKTRTLHKAFLRYHDPKNWPLLREALIRMGRKDLIGKGKNCLVPEATKNRRFSDPRRHYTNLKN